MDQEPMKSVSPSNTANPFPHEILEKIFSLVDSHDDRDAISLVCKDWYNAERWTRSKLCIRNCYSPTMARAFPRITSVRIKGKSRFHNTWTWVLPWDGGGDLHSWVVMFAEIYPFPEELRLQRMTVSEESLELLAKTFTGFKALSLSDCYGLTGNGLKAIATHCRNLTELNIEDDLMVPVRGGWLSCFPENFASLEILNFACLKTRFSFDELETLVTRCRSLRVLKVNENITLDQLGRLLVFAPRVTELGIGSFGQDLTPSQYEDIESAFKKCKNLQCLSFFSGATGGNLPVLYEACAGLTFLNLMGSLLHSGELAKLVAHCPNLRRLWVSDTVENEGLMAVGSSCPLLEELRVLPVATRNLRQYRYQGVTELGLLDVSRGCPKLHHIVYFCRTMTNAAVVTVLNNCPNFTHFRLYIKRKRQPDHLTNEPFDEAFAAVVKTCTNLQRLSISGLITNLTFEYIGKYGKNLEMLSMGFGAGCSDEGVHCVLEGCLKLRKIEIRNCPFGNYAAFMSGLEKYDTLDSRWMSARNVISKKDDDNVTYKKCRVLLARKMARLDVVDVIKDEESDYGGVVHSYFKVAPFVRTF